MNKSTSFARHAAVVAVASATGTAFSISAAAPAAAHERWFVENTEGGDWGFFFSPVPLALAAAAVAATGLWRLIARRLPRPELPPLRRLGGLTPYAPHLLAAGIGLALVALAAMGKFASPSIELDRLPVAPAARAVEVALGLWLITGRWLRFASVGLLMLAVAVGLVAGPVAVLESAILVGVAGFLAVVAPANTGLRTPDPEPERLRVGLFSLRCGIGVSLVTLAFSEKLTNPELAERTLTAYSQLDLPALVGLPMSQETFIAIAAAAELLFGLLLLSGAMPQAAVLMAAVPFTATLPLFGWTELIGHLPVYGVFLVLLVYGSTSATAPGVAWVPRQREAAERPRPTSYSSLRKELLPAQRSRSGSSAGNRVGKR